MGTWGPHSFDNDTAADLLVSLDGYDQPFERAEAVRATFEEVFSTTVEDMEADTGAAAIAGAEIVASALGQPLDGAKQSFDLAKSFTFYDDTVGMALAALKRVGDDDSELAELWADTDETKTWRASVDDLTTRLVAAAKAHDLSTDFDPPHPDETPEDALRAEVDRVYEDMMSEIERLADKADGDPQVEVLRHLVRKMNLIHKDITNMRYFVVDSLDALTARIDGLEKKTQ
ncbi:DUF4259 domain-containing protein [Ruegeria sp. R14_0]|uniref:DUF4259 domain-containing protein n=1 Tax=Ruegeria sp. R14_0 TaxID=2821100 RepID=UPI001ADA9EBD|nr:DUF4259 domain-containing protein [Ruegeria sp. R14_0]MBO9446440.1 DUF4259 domain-containing protein [Ruegeria sp. R14_0]